MICATQTRTPGYAGFSASYHQQLCPDLNDSSAAQARHSLHPPSPWRPAAKTQLALSLRQSLRTRAALRSVRPVTRSFATPVSHGAKTESTTLSNGFTVSRCIQYVFDHMLTNVSRSLPSILLGHRHPLLASGLTLEVGPRRIGRMAPHIS